MSERAQKLLDEVLALPEPDRARLAAELLASLDAETDDDAEAAWSAEITRRARRAHADPDAGIDWDVARAELGSGLRRP